MIVKLSNILTDFFIKKNIIDIQEKEVYCYCFELLIAFLINLNIAIIIGFACLQFLETIIFIVVFLSLRTAAGGFHAKTHFRCITLFSIVFLIFILIIKLTNISPIVNITLLTISSIIVNLLSPIDCKENRLEQHIKNKLKIKIFIFTIIYFIIAITLSILKYNRIAFAFTYPMTSVCLSLVYAKIIKQ